MRRVPFRLSPAAASRPLAESLRPAPTPANRLGARSCAPPDHADQVLGRSRSNPSSSEACSAKATRPAGPPTGAWRRTTARTGPGSPTGAGAPARWCRRRTRAGDATTADGSASASASEAAVTKGVGEHDRQRVAFIRFRRLGEASSACRTASASERPRSSTGVAPRRRRSPARVRHERRPRRATPPAPAGGQNVLEHADRDRGRSDGESRGARRLFARSSGLTGTATTFMAG
jgi:hypothetical protein